MRQREANHPAPEQPLGFITGLEGALAEEKCALVAAEEQAAVLRERLEALEQQTRAAEDALHELQKAQLSAMEKLAEAQKQEAEAHTAINIHLQQVAAQTAARRGEVEAATVTAQRGLEEKRKNSDAATAEAEAALARFQEKRNLALSVLNEQEERHRLFRDELQQVARQLTNNVNNAAGRAASARIEQEAAEKTAALARHSAEELAAAITAADEDIQARQDAITRLHQEVEQEAEALKQKTANALAAVKQMEEAAAREANIKRQEREKAQSLANLAQRSYLNADEKAADIAKRLRQLYADAEQAAAAKAEQMERALRHAIEQREAYVKALNAANEINEQAGRAIQEEADLREQIMRLRLEDHDLRNAALIAGNLAADATVSRLNADREMIETLTEMERALAAAAEEAKQQSAAKTAELAAAEAARERAALRAAQKRQAVKETEKQVRAAEESCNAAEQTMFELSADIERRARENSGIDDKRIHELHQAYDETVREAAALKEAADHTNNNLRLIKNETEKAERAFIDTIHHTRQVQAACAAESADAEERRQARIAEAYSRLNIAKEKRERLFEAYLKKQDGIASSESALALKNETLRNAEQQLAACKQQAENELATWKVRLDEQLAADETALANVQQEAAAAADAYDQAKLASLRATQETQQAMDELLRAEEEEKEQLAASAAQREAAEQKAAAEREAVAARCRAAEQAVQDYINPQRLAELDIARLRKERGRLIAGLELQKLRLRRHQDAAERLEAEEAALIAAEQQRLAEEAAAAALAARQAEEARRRKEEAERKRAKEEAERLETEREAARVAAEAEVARLAARRAEQAAAAEREAMRMAAGEVLSREENIALVESGALIQRMQRLRELAEAEAKAGNFRWVKPEEAAALRQEAGRLRARAKESGRLFESARVTLLSLSQQRREQKEQRYAMGPVWAARIAALDRAIAEHAAFGHAYQSMAAAQSRASAAAQPLLAHLRKDMEKALASSEQAIAARRAELLATEQEVRRMEAALQETEKSYRESGDLLYEIACNWIYQENLALKAAAKLAEIDREAAERAAIDQAARERFTAARQAATSATEQAQRVGSVPRKAGPAKRRKRK